MKYVFSGVMQTICKIYFEIKVLSMMSPAETAIYER